MMTRQPLVFILEDQMMVAFALKSMLSERGIGTVGPYADAESALQALESVDFDFALLDINLGGDLTSEEVADALIDRNKPFAFVTGYGSSAPLPEKFSHVDRLNKPLRPQDIYSIIDMMVASGTAAPN